MTVTTQTPQFWSDWEKTSQNFLTTDINIGNFWMVFDNFLKTYQNKPQTDKLWKDFTQVKKRK